jgi:hypothetical protein
MRWKPAPSSGGNHGIGIKVAKMHGTGYSKQCKRPLVLEKSHGIPLLESNQRSLNTMQDQYVAPELKLVGEASEVVLGMPGPGGDLIGEAIVAEMEFQAD